MHYLEQSTPLPTYLGRPADTPVTGVTGVTGVTPVIQIQMESDKKCGSDVCV